MFKWILRLQDVFKLRFLWLSCLWTVYCGFTYICISPVAKAASSVQSFDTSIDYTMHRLATEYNDPSAQYLVGRNYLKGKSVEKNVQEAIKWFEMAAKQNHIRAQYQLGKIYLYGEGVKANLNYAHYFLNKAAEKNHLDSQYELGNYYLQVYPEDNSFPIHNMNWETIIFRVHLINANMPKPSNGSGTQQQETTFDRSIFWVK